MKKPSKSVRIGIVETQWKDILQRIDANRLRRGRTMAKQGAVTITSIDGGMIDAEVDNMGFGVGSEHVVMPTVDWWIPYFEQISLWLGRRPDWLAALLMGEWDAGFLEFIETAGLKIFPSDIDGERILSTSTCTCRNLERPCRHVIATLYRIIGDSEKSPFLSFEYLGLEKESLLERVHAATMVMNSSTAREIDLENENWHEEGTLRQDFVVDDSPWNQNRMTPVLDTDKLIQWKKTYMAWK